MTRCHCTSPSCPNPQHPDLVCGQPAELEVQSLDWGEEIIAMCYRCGLEARLSGMFRRAARKPQLPMPETVIDDRLC